MRAHANLQVALLVGMLALGVRADEFEPLTRQFRETLLARSPRSEFTGHDRSLQTDGSWSDVNYEDQTRGGWQTYTHLSRVYAMAQAYTRPQSPRHQDPALAGAIHRALGYWLKHDFQNSNWWYNVIGVPQIMGDIGILLHDELTSSEREILVDRIMPRGKVGMTGQNRVWVASVTLVRGLLLKDRSMVANAAGVIGEEIRVAPREGVQPDFSFHQHGPQQQFGNYGLAFARSAVTWLQVFAGTPFALPSEKGDIVRNYLMQGEAWVIWKGRMDLSSCGRQLRKGSAWGKGQDLAGIMEQMSHVDSARAGEYRAYLRRNQDRGVNDLVGNRNFWRSDYMIQRRPEFYASIKMCSRRVIGGELVNSENVSGYHLADGALLVYRTGLEYDDIQPVWDWQKIPGTTCPQRSGGPPRLTKSYRIASSFVGGVSDGTNGCAAMDYVRDGVKARKAWFFFDDSIACLGAGITSETNHPVVTTINQCWWQGEVRACEAGKVRTLERGEHQLAKLEWVWHDGIGYLFPTPARVKLTLGEQRGSWRKVEEKPQVPPAEVAGDVFLMAFEHGLHPRDADYCWVMLPGVKAEAMPEKARQLGVAVLANTPRLQAVCASRGGLSQAVFYEPASVNTRAAKTITVDQPCLLLLDDAGATPRVTIADPTQELAGPLHYRISTQGK